MTKSWVKTAEIEFLWIENICRPATARLETHLGRSKLKEQKHTRFEHFLKIFGTVFIQTGASVDALSSSHASLRISQLTRFCIRVMADVFNNVLIIFKRCGWMHTWASEGSFPGGGSIVDFPELPKRFFEGGAENVETSFFSLETKKIILSC